MTITWMQYPDGTRQDKIEFAMDYLGADYVEKRIKIILGEQDTTKAINKLTKGSGWIPDYNKLRDELVLEAKKKSGLFEKEIITK